MATPSARAPTLLLGHDLSTVLQCEAHGVQYYDFDSASPEPPEQIVSIHGANLLRIRVWVHPPAGYSDFSSMLAMAQRAARAHLRILLCLHLSDYWADPSQQATPAAWADQDFPTLCDTVAAYVARVVEALQAQRTPPFVVAVGNEISNGMLWPTGKVTKVTTNPSNSSQFTSLLKSGLAAVKGVGAATMVHINKGQDADLVTWFMDMMVAHDVSFDYLGLSFYPGEEGAVLSDLEASLASAAARYHKPMVIAEVADHWSPPPSSSPGKQAASLGALLKVLSGVPGGLGVGVCYWESGWIGTGEAYPGEGNRYWTRALWDEQGRALPALRCYEPYAEQGSLLQHNKYEEEFLQATLQPNGSSSTGPNQEEELQSDDGIGMSQESLHSRSPLLGLRDLQSDA